MEGCTLVYRCGPPPPPPQSASHGCEPTSCLCRLIPNPHQRASKPKRRGGQVGQPWPNSQQRRVDEELRRLRQRFAGAGVEAVDLNSQTQLAGREAADDPLASDHESVSAMVRAVSPVPVFELVWDPTCHLCQVEASGSSREGSPLPCPLTPSPVAFGVGGLSPQGSLAAVAAAPTQPLAKRAGGGTKEEQAQKEEGTKEEGTKEVLPDATAVGTGSGDESTVATGLSISGPTLDLSTHTGSCPNTTVTLPDGLGDTSFPGAVHQQTSLDPLGGSSRLTATKAVGARVSPTQHGRQRPAARVSRKSPVSSTSYPVSGKAARTYTHPSRTSGARGTTAAATAAATTATTTRPTRAHTAAATTITPPFRGRTAAVRPPPSIGAATTLRVRSKLGSNLPLAATAQMGVPPKASTTPSPHKRPTRFRQAGTLPPATFPHWVPCYGSSIFYHKDAGARLYAVEALVLRAQAALERTQQQQAGCLLPVQMVEGRFEGRPSSQAPCYCHPRHPIRRSRRSNSVDSAICRAAEGGNTLKAEMRRLLAALRHQRWEFARAYGCAVGRYQFAGLQQQQQAQAGDDCCYPAAPVEARCDGLEHVCVDSHPHFHHPPRSASVPPPRPTFQGLNATLPAKIITTTTTAPFPPAALSTGLDNVSYMSTATTTTATAANLSFQQDSGVTPWMVTSSSSEKEEEQEECSVIFNSSSSGGSSSSSQEAESHSHAAAAAATTASNTRLAVLAATTSTGTHSSLTSCASPL